MVPQSMLLRADSQNDHLGPKEPVIQAGTAGQPLPPAHPPPPCSGRPRPQHRVGRDRGPGGGGITLYQESVYLKISMYFMHASYGYI